MAIEIKFIKKISHACIFSILLCFMQDSSYESFFISLCQPLLKSVEFKEAYR